MRTTTKIVLAGALIGAAVADSAGPANAQYYPPPPPYGYGYGGQTWNGCPPGYTVQGGNCAPYRGPSGRGWRTWNGCPPATRCRAAIVRPIKVRSADRRAEGMATELTRTRVQRYPVVRLSRRNFATEISRLRCSSGGRCGDCLNRGN